MLMFGESDAWATNPCIRPMLQVLTMASEGMGQVSKERICPPPSRVGVLHPILSLDQYHPTPQFSVIGEDQLSPVGGGSSRVKKST